MARSEKFLLALASLFFAGIFWWGVFGAVRHLNSFLGVRDAQLRLFTVWESRRENGRFPSPSQVPEWKEFVAPDTKVPFAANSQIVGKRLEDFSSPEKVIAIYEPLSRYNRNRRSVVFLDKHFKRLLPEAWEIARRESGIVENPPELRPWWKFWQSGPRVFFPREAFAGVCIELWLSFCVLNAIWFGRWAGARRGFGRFWFSLASSFACGLGLAFAFLMASSLFRL